MVEASGKRVFIMVELTIMAQTFWDRWDDAKIIAEIPERNYVAKQLIDNGLPVTMVKFRADGLTEEIFSRWSDDPFSIGPAMNNKLTRENLPDDEGYKVVHMKMKMPMMISNRSMISCIYNTRSGLKKVIIHSS